MSISESLPLASLSKLTIKQQKNLDDLSLCVSQIGIEIELNPKDTGRYRSQIVALDVEHDESGGFVGCGLWNGIGTICYYDDIKLLNDIDFHTLDIIAHNGVSDIECLNIWGIKVDNKQLIWDTMLIGHIQDSSLKSYSLKDMAKRELGISYSSYDDIVGKRGLKAERITLDKQPVELVSKYNALDVYSTWKLYERQKKVTGL